MTEIEREIMDGLRDAFAKALKRRGRERIEDTLNNWLAFTTRKKASEALPKQLEDFRKRIRVLAQNLTIDVGPHGCVVKTSGSGQDTLRLQERGSDCFDPAGNLTEMIVGAVFDERI